MKLRHASLFAAGLGSFAMLSALPAAAAVTVLGAGLAQACYQAAEYNGNPKEGIAACSASLDQETLTADDRAATYVNRGILHARRKEPRKAISDYDTGLRISPKLAEGYVDRGASYIMLRRYKQALNDIDEGLRLGTKRPHIAYYDRAIAHEGIGDIRAAYQDYRHAVELAPDFKLAVEQLKRFRVIRKPADNGS